MEDTLKRLRSDARHRFGPERSIELEPILQSVARDLTDLAQYALEPDDVP